MSFTTSLWEYPDFRFTPWNDLQPLCYQWLAGDMLYNESTWNNPGSHDVERFSFDSLNLHPGGNQGVASDLGFNEGVSIMI